LKPENFIFVTNTNDSLLKLIDFGLSAFYSDEMGVKTMKTRAGSVLRMPNMIALFYGSRGSNWQLQRGL
jgi:serine/threonine protein kinase